MDFILSSVAEYLSSSDIIHLAICSKKCIAISNACQSPPPLCFDYRFAMYIVRLRDRYTGHIPPYQLRAMCSIHPRFLRNVIRSYGYMTITGLDKSRCNTFSTWMLITGCDVIPDVVVNEPDLTPYFIRWFNPRLFMYLDGEHTMITVIRILHQYKCLEVLVSLMASGALVMGTSMMEMKTEWRKDRGPITASRLSTARKCCDKFLRTPFPISSDETYVLLEWARRDPAGELKLILQAYECGMISAHGICILAFTIDTPCPIPQILIDIALPLRAKEGATPTASAKDSFKRRAQSSTFNAISRASMDNLRAAAVLSAMSDPEYLSSIPLDKVVRLAYSDRAACPQKETEWKYNDNW